MPCLCHDHRAHSAPNAGPNAPFLANRSRSLLGHLAYRLAALEFTADGPARRRTDHKLAAMLNSSQELIEKFF